MDTGFRVVNGPASRAMESARTQVTEQADDDFEVDNLSVGLAPGSRSGFQLDKTLQFLDRQGNRGLRRIIIRLSTKMFRLPTKVENRGEALDRSELMIGLAD